MTKYPFDSQTCYAEVEIDNAGQYISLQTDTMEYNGPPDVMQYVIAETDYIKYEGRVKVKLVLGRRLLSVVLTTIVPTLLIIVVALSTNYYNEEHFKTIIPVNLTALLLMVTLFIGVSARLPQTSYLKMIDIWLLFTLVVPFVNAVLHGYLDFLRTRLKSLKADPRMAWSPETSGKIFVLDKTVNEQNRQNEKLVKKLGFKMKVVQMTLMFGVPVFAVIFTITFFSVGFLIKH